MPLPPIEAASSSQEESFNIDNLSYRFDDIDLKAALPDILTKPPVAPKFKNQQILPLQNQVNKEEPVQPKVVQSTSIRKRRKHRK